MTFNSYINGELKAHQGEAVKYFLPHPYTVCADEMGLGKTLEALMVSFIENKPTLIICPATLKLGWAEEIHKFSAVPKHVSIIDKGPEIYQHCSDLDDFIIINFEQALHAEKLFEWADFVFIDEAHYLKNVDTQRSIFIDKFLYEKEIERCILLTGTPIENRVDEWHQLLVLCSFDPAKKSGISVEEAFSSKNAFCENFAHKRITKVRGRHIVTWEGIKNVPELKKLLIGKYIRREQKEVLDLPPTIDKIIPASFKDDSALLKQWAEHDKDESIGISAKKKSADIKAKFTVKYIKELQASGEEAIVVFTDHRSSAIYMANAFGGFVIHGGVSKVKRHELKTKFQAGKIPVLVCTIRAAGVGLTLTRARTMVLNDLSWVPGQNMQAKKRIHRIGQERRCFYHYIVGSKQDAYIQKLLTKKEKVIREAT